MQKFKTAIYAHLKKGFDFNVKTMASDAVRSTDMKFDGSDPDYSGMGYFEATNVRQLNEGLNKDGQSLGRYKDVNMGRSYKFSPLEPVDLMLTGDFHRSITAQVQSYFVRMIATDEKTDILTEYWGDDILGIDLDAPTAQPLLDQLIIEAQDAIRHQINGRS